MKPTPFKSLVTGKTRYYILTMLVALAVIIGNAVLQKPNVAKAASVQIDCSGTWASPTAVTESGITSSDDVTFTDAGGDGWCVLDAPISANTVTINTGAVVTHADEDTDGVTITTVGAMTINGQINAFARGCKSLSASADGYGPNGSNVCSALEGGAGYGKTEAGGVMGAHHGGWGGGGSSVQGGGEGMPSYYGSATAPVLFGSSGGSYSTQAIGGAGGGFIVLDIGGTLTNDGFIGAVGAAGTTYSTDSAGGGGSGGSVYITANKVDGSGTMQADGGNGASNTSAAGGGGGGGRISVIINDSSGTFTFASGTLPVSGGTGGTGGGGGTAGDKGTVYVRDMNGDDTLDSDDDVQIFNGFTFADADFSVNTWTSDSSAINQRCDWDIASGATPSVTASTSLSFGGSFICNIPAGTITSFGLSSPAVTFAADSSFMVNASAVNISPTGNVTLSSGVAVENFGGTLTLSPTGTLTINSNSDISSSDALYLGAGTDFALTGSGVSLNVDGTGEDLTFNVPAGDTQTWTDLTVNLPAASEFIIDDAVSVTLAGSTDINANINWTNIVNLTQNSGTYIDASGLGCSSTAVDGSGPDGSNVCTASTAGWGDGDSADGGYQGAGHGGTGGLGTSASYNAGGATYGSSANPILFGSSGGAWESGKGGVGGGLIKINLTGTLTHNGVIRAEGGEGYSHLTNETAGGGGSGGSINISANTYTCSTGTFDASGGGGGEGVTSAGGGGGGGGRIAVAYLTDSSGSCPLSGLTAAGVAPGGTGGSTASAGNTGSLRIGVPIIDVACSGTSGSPTAVDEASLSGAQVTFLGTGWCQIDAPVNAYSVDVESGVTLTHAQGDADGFNITTTGDFTLNGTINTNSKGCQSSSNSNGYGPNGSNVCTQNTAGYGGGDDYSGKGGGHGGTGGNGYVPNTSGVTYGSAVNPILFGSSGGSYYGTSFNGGYGGGLVLINVSGTFTHNGSIFANGGGGIVEGGGGSGGSIKINASAFAGSSGAFSAVGGNNTSTGLGGGGGGGGRVAVIYNSATYSLDSADFNVNGGTSTKRVAGAKGTVYVRDMNGDGVQDEDDDVTIYHGFTYTDTDWVLNSFIFDTSATNQYCDSAILSTATPSITATGSQLNFGGSFACGKTISSFTLSSDLGVATLQNSILNIPGALTISSGSGPFALGIDSSVTSSGAVNFSAATSFTLFEGATITNNGLNTDITFDIPDGNNQTWDHVTINGPAEGELLIDAAISLTLDDTSGGTAVNANVNWPNITDLTIDAGSSINTNSKGCRSSSNSNGYGPNGSNVCTQNTAGYGGGDDYSGKGGGHGGTGGNGYVPNTSGVTYGSAVNPILFGSSGGSYYGTSFNGGYGGGLVLINVSGTFTHNGSIFANGGGGIVEGGGGSGGSIKINASAFAGSSGAFSAVGGNNTSTGLGGGGGGGGRVAVIYNSATYSLDSADFNVNGGTSTKRVAGAKGTVYVRDMNGDGVQDEDDDVTIYHGFTYTDTDWVLNSFIFDTSATNQYCDSAILSTATPSITATGSQLNFGGSFACGKTISSFTLSSDLGVATLQNSILNIPGALTISSGSGPFALGIDSSVTSSGAVNFSAATSFTLFEGATITNNGLNTDITFDIPDGNNQTWDHVTINGPAEGELLIDAAISLTLDDTSGGTAVNANVNWPNITDLTIDAGSSINAAGKGCRGSSNPRNGYGPNGSNVCAQSTAGYGGGSDYGGGGASHAGVGGWGYASAAGGPAYGSATNPILFGSSGGSGAYSGGCAGGYGGGLVLLDISGVFTHNGIISANGANGPCMSGAGSGGSININSGSYNCNTGTFSAKGGNTSVGSLGAGGGGGGRINIATNSDISTGCPLAGLTVSGTVSGGTVNVGGAGTAGTLRFGCGDGLILGGETCDDGNATGGDGCSAVCAIESGWLCSGEPSVCHELLCGDGLAEGSETCDDGGTANGDGCDSTCQLNKTGYGYSLPITIDHTKVGDNLTNFPVLLKDGNFASDVYTRAESDGRDLIFSSDEAGTNLIPSEIVNWNSGGQTGEVWVKVPSISSTTDTTFWVWYDNPSATLNASAKNVWASNYKAVWHLNEQVTDEQTTGTHYDATSNANNGSQSGNAYYASGKIGGAQAYDGTNDYINVPSLTWTPASFSVSFWLYPLANSDYNQQILATNAWGGFVFHTTATGGVYAGTDSTNRLTPTNIPAGTVALNGWQMFTFTYNNGIGTFYKNGSIVASKSGMVSPTAWGGFQIGTGTANTINGRADEVRVSSINRSAGWISTEYNNQNSPSTFIIRCGDGIIASGEQCDDGNTANGDGCSSTCQLSTTGYNSSQAITIYNGKVDDDLSSFPVLLKDNVFGGTSGSIYTNTKTDGSDLLFTSDVEGTTFLPFEVVNWNKAGGTSEVWVKPSSIANATDTTIYVWYNNSSAIMPGATATNGKRNVWSSNYKAVWHLNEAVTDEGTTGIHYDSTVNANNGNQSGNDDVAGKIGNAQSFDGSGDNINFGNPPGLQITGGQTIEMWVKPTNFSARRNPYAKAYGGEGTLTIETNGNVSYYYGTAGGNNSPYQSFVMDNPLVAGEWSYLVVTRDLTAMALQWYKNGSAKNSATASYSSAVASSLNTYLGQGYVDNFLGTLDEIRISGTSRTAGWISTSYNNQNSPSTFAGFCGNGAIGGTETCDDGNAVSDDGCSSTCTVESGYECTGEPSVCEMACGNGAINTGEQCDDGGTANGDGCNSTCELSKTGYGYSLPITIDHTKVGENLTNFPVLLKDGNFAGDVYTRAESDGRDLIFSSDEAGTNLIPSEIVNWNSGGTSEVWVKIPSISSATDTTFWVWYDNSSAILNSSAKNVWTGYSGIWHMNEDVTDEGSAQNVYIDSSLNNLHGDQGGSSEIASGPLQNAQSFDGNDYIDNLGDNTNFSYVQNNGIFTVGSWMKLNNYTLDNPQTIFSNTPNTAEKGFVFFYENRTGLGTKQMRFISTKGVSGDSIIDSMSEVNSIMDNNWHYVVTTGNGTNVTFYIDGNPDTGTGTMDVTKSSGDATRASNIGRYPYSTPGGYMNGYIDQVYILPTIHSAGWISTEYNNQNSPSTFIIRCGDGIIASGEQCDDGNANETDGCSSTCQLSTTGYASSQAITIYNGKVDDDLSGFPVLLKDNVFGSSGGSIYTNTKTDGSDLLFTSDVEGTTFLPFEVVSWNKAGGTSEVWVKPSSIANAADTTIYVWYNNSSAIAPGATAANGKNAVWSNGYAGVWHLNENPAGTAPQMTDSTSNSFNGTSSGGMVSGDQIAGKIGGSLNFENASSQRISTADIDAINSNNFGVSLWFNPTQTFSSASASSMGLFGKDDGNNNFLAGYLQKSTGKIGFDDEAGTDASDSLFTSTASWTAGTWYNVYVDYNDSTGRKIFINGTQNASDSNTNGPGIGVNAFNIAYSYIPSPDEFTTKYFNGMIDEVRVVSGNRSAGWISTEYNNQNNPSTFAGFCGNGAIGGTEACDDGNNANDDGCNSTCQLSKTGYGYSLPIIIDHTKVGESLTNFPVLLKDANFASDVYTRAESNGRDLIFSSDEAGTTLLPSEVVSWNSGGTGEVWVKVPSISSTTDTTFWVWYDNPSAILNSSAKNVWDSNYKAVWHLNETVTDEQTNGIYYDSTSNGNNGTQNNTGVDASGKVGKATIFDKTADYIALSGVATTANVTYETWLKPNGSTWRNFMSYNGDNHWFVDSSNILNMYNASYQSTSAITNGVWSSFAYIYDGTNSDIYINGSLNKHGSTDARIPTMVNRFGYDASSENYDGSMDEIRISSIARSTGWISTEYNNQNSPSTFIIRCGDGTVATGEQCDDGNVNETDGCSSACQISHEGFNYKQSITIDYTKVGETVTNFPVLLKDANFASDVYTQAEADGKDLLFTSDEEGTTFLPFEIVNWSNGGTSEVWVNVPSISNSTNTTFWVWYDNPSAIAPVATAANGKRNVWSNNNYKAVWHLNETVTDETTGAVHYDSTSSGINGTQYRNVNTTGKIGAAQSFDGTSDYIIIPNTGSANGQSAGTLSAWYYPNSAPSGCNAGVYYESTTSAGYSRFSIFHFSAGTALAAVRDSNTGTSYSSASSGALGLNQWHYVVSRFDSATDVIQLHVDQTAATPETTAKGSITTGNPADPIAIGEFSYASSPCYINGKIDEVRVSTVSRSAGWVTTEYNNQNDTTTFVTTGTPESGLPYPKFENFPVEYGTTNFTALNTTQLESVSTMKLANQYGYIKWKGNNVFAKSEDYDSYVKIGSGFVSMDPAHLHNTLSNGTGGVSGFNSEVKMNVAGCESYTVYYATGFRSSLQEIKDNGQICNESTTPACTNIRCVNGVLTFDVPHFDGYGGEGIPLGISTTVGVSNLAPVIITTPSDGGSDSTNKTPPGGNVTFTATAKDANGDQYYLAICKTDAVTAGNNTAPTCPGDAWVISVAANSDAQASVNHLVQSGDPEENAWYAFVCDKFAGGGACFPANGSGDQGLSVGTVTFSGIPVDGATVTIDSTVYEFDTANDGITEGNTEVDSYSAQSTSDVAKFLSLADTGGTIGSHITYRANADYIFANAKGVGGNSIAMAKAGDTGDLITLSGTNLAGGSDANMSPFYVNQITTFGSLTVTDESDSTIEPGDTLKFKLPQSEVVGSSYNMYICTNDTTAFDYDTNTCTGGSLACSDLAVNPASEDGICTDGGTLASVPTAHGSHDYKVYVEDIFDLPAEGTNTQSYTVEDVPPEIVSYNLTDTPSTSAGGSDTVDFSAVVSDDNGDNDVTAVDGVLFDDDTVNISAGTCTESESNCYIDVTCTLNTAYGDGAELEAQCQITMWFNANASANWEAHLNPTDELGRLTNLSDSNTNLNNPALSGIDVVQTSLAYGSVVIGGTSAGLETSMGNMGNQAIDIYLDGNNMCTDYPVCSDSQLPVGQQKWHHNSGVFDWDAEGTGPGPYTLVDTASGTGDSTGCLNRDIAVRTVHGTADTNESIFWKLRIPSGQKAGSYTGQNTFTTTAGGTCTTGGSY